MEHNEGHNLCDLVKSDVNIALVRKLLARGANPKFENFLGDTLLHIALQSTEDNVEILQELINTGAYNNGWPLASPTLLHYAVIYRNKRVVEALLTSRIDINRKGWFGRTVLHDAVTNIPYSNIPSHARVPDLWTIRKILEQKHINVNEQDMDLHTPLMEAVRHKHLEVVKLLLKHGSNIDASNKKGETSLHIALRYEDPCPYIVVLLLLKRADLLKLDHAGKTPLNGIFRYKSVHFARICLKVIAFNYRLKKRLMIILFKNPELTQHLERCNAEILRMKGDIIANKMTVFDFFFKCAPKSGFRNPISRVFNPVVERIITGNYPEYFSYILHRISKSYLSEALECAVEEKYCKKNCDDKDCKKEHPTPFTEVLRIGLISNYLSSFDIFRLIVIFSRVKVHESILNIRQHECYLTDSWEEYPDDYFLMKQ